MGRIFGTDGARGVANTEISCTLTMNIGRALAMLLAEKIGRQPVILVGKDTRLSSDMLEAALSAGICSVGASVIQAGVLPTPAVAYLVACNHADSGVMLSASHNPYEFNGIKVFGPGGVKMTAAEEFAIEEIVLDEVKPYLIRWGWELGRMSRKEDLVDEYVAHLRETVEGDLSGLRIAVDCSNGSASATALPLLQALGAKVDVIHCTPNGVNINRDCGSTHVESLAERVRDGAYDAGIAFDGDADRCLAVDEKGELVDGDTILAILAMEFKRRGQLKKNTIVGTIMSNMGLHRFAEEQGIRLETTRVGDRYVHERMQKSGYNLGGEQSGHLILSDYMNTGDGQLSAIHLLSALKTSGKPMSELAAVMTTYPQVLSGFRADSRMKSALPVDEGVEKIIAEAKEELGADGRILVRASGTEPLIRVMVEGQDRALIEQLAQSLTEQLADRLSQNECYRHMHY